MKKLRIYFWFEIKKLTVGIKIYCKIKEEKTDECVLISLSTVVFRARNSANLGTFLKKKPHKIFFIHF